MSCFHSLFSKGCRPVGCGEQTLWRPGIPAAWAWEPSGWGKGEPDPTAPSWSSGISTEHCDSKGTFARCRSVEKIHVRPSLCDRNNHSCGSLSTRLYIWKSLCFSACHVWQIMETAIYIPNSAPSWVHWDVLQLSIYNAVDAVGE